jgi:hypothetical protein
MVQDACTMQGFGRIQGNDSEAYAFFGDQR